MDMRALLEPKKQLKSNKVQKNGENKSVNRSTPEPVDHGHGHPKSSPRKATNGSTTASPTTNRYFDPRALLNPKSSKAGVKSSSIDLSTSNSASDSENRQSSGKKSHNLLESMYGVERRQEYRPVKRVKTGYQTDDSNDSKGQNRGSTRHGNAGVGEYFKPRPEDAKGNTTLPTAIDLTLSDDDDDLQITGVVNTDDKEVCYGMLDGHILAYTVPKPAKINTSSQFGTNQWPVFKVQLSRQKDQNNTITCFDPHNTAFGKIEAQLSETLAPIMDAFPKLRTQCRLTTRPQKPGEWAHQPCSEKLRMVINIYGRKGDVDRIGKFFGQRNYWFKQPMISDPNIEICNPHAQKRKQIQSTYPSHAVVNTTRTLEEATDAVSKLFDFQAQEGNELVETEQPRDIITPLLPHQKQALTFMLRKENPRTFASEEAGNSSLWRKKSGNRGPVYEEVVTGIQVHEEPEQTLGGLLADVMGLGKTLQALSLIASTKSEAAAFGQAPLVRKGEDEAVLRCTSRATLLVAPVSTIKNWEDQIKEHARGASMLYTVYHGSNRERNPFVLADNDVVLTTYGTAATEMFGKNKDENRVSPLASVKWYRIILDEAHTIRESKSIQARAMYSLFATRRWCLTGTPIQNRIDDLGSLTTFLRLYPYNSTAKFNQYVKAPAQSGDVSYLKKLRVMVDSFTLRRLRDQIHLPDRQDLAVELEFSPEERHLHDWFREQFRVTLKQLNAENESTHRAAGSQYHRVLKGITLLRLICDHGQELLKQRELNDYKSSQQSGELVIIEEDAGDKLPKIEKQKAFDHFNLMAEAGVDQCVMCGRSLTSSSPGTPSMAENMADDNLAVVLPCLDTLCIDCFNPHKSTFNAAKRSVDVISCPNAQCSYSYEAQYVAIPRAYAEQLDMVPEETTGADNAVFKNGFYTGPHTKVKQLLNDIGQIYQESAPLVEAGEPPLKCVIFSEFTSNLDLIGKALHDYGHTFVRIDGTMTLTARRKVIDALNKDDSVTILLASIKAAGQGLNLTAASRCFIMEPLWNPAAEAQAIDRIYRIGQSRPVIVRRYRMKSSMEDKIIALQERKKAIADMSLEKKEVQRLLNKKDRNEKSLQQMLDFFKN